VAALLSLCYMRAHKYFRWFTIHSEFAMCSG
jgi:hypothetical protein